MKRLTELERGRQSRKVRPGEGKQEDEVHRPPSGQRLDPPARALGVTEVRLDPGDRGMRRNAAIGLRPLGKHEDFDLGAQSVAHVAADASRGADDDHPGTGAVRRHARPKDETARSSSS